ncbi:MAG: hypothetical protein QCH96_06220 [Candidatus Thermoplasmatota archaeon]|nr:hypothetical protein [Candidatus Thermoplasmatota archaeon]
MNLDGPFENTSTIFLKLYINFKFLLISRRYSKELIKIIRKEVLSGKNKYSVAKEMSLPDKVVYYHTKDILSKNPGRTEIRRKGHIH